MCKRRTSMSHCEQSEPCKIKVSVRVFMNGYKDVSVMDENEMMCELT